MGAKGQNMLNSTCVVGNSSHSSVVVVAVVSHVCVTNNMNIHNNTFGQQQLGKQEILIIGYWETD